MELVVKLYDKSPIFSKTMSRKDFITGKGCLFGNRRSHALNATRRKFSLNLQTIRLPINGRRCKIRVSASTLRTLRKRKVI